MATRFEKEGFLNYPEPLRGPEVPYKNERKSNPAIRGRLLIACALLMEWFRFVREMVWRNAGFGSLRQIRPYIEECEPLFEPTIVPTAGPSLGSAKADELGLDEDSDLALGTTELTAPPATKYPQERYYSAADYHALYKSGELTPTDVARALLPLIRRDTSPPGRYSVGWFEVKVELVMAAAEASTQRYREGRPLGPLDGVPAAVKDEYDMEGYITCLGSVNDYTGRTAEHNSLTTWCVRKLEEAGVVIYGKLHMVEFGLDTPGNNPFYGTPPNPYNEKYYTGGSSSGAGYAIAAGLIPIALGSDGGGSIRIPSSFCSVFGLKPSGGRISFRPGMNHCTSCATLGPMAADVRSLAAVYEVIGQPHPTSPFPPVAPAAALLAPSAKRPKLLGIPEAWFARAAPGVQQLCRDMVGRLVREQGYRVVPISIPFLTEGQTAHAMTVLTDGATLLPPSERSSLTDVTRILLAIGSVTPSTDYMLAQKLRRLLMRHLAALWQEHPGMLIVTPTTACAGWPIRGGAAELSHGVSDGDRTIASMEYVWMANFCGLPAVSVPAGYAVPEGKGQPRAGQPVAPGAAAPVPGMVPVGLMAAGEWAAEPELLRFALDAEALGAEARARPPIWFDVVEAAKAGRATVA